MCSHIMCYVLLETTMLCMCRTIYLKPVNECVEPIIYTTSCIYDQCMSYLFGAQLLVLLNG
jgi:hypothetical protein